jgi:hypothetical protein
VLCLDCRLALRRPKPRHHQSFALGGTERLHCCALGGRIGRDDGAEIGRSLLPIWNGALRHGVMQRDVYHNQGRV